MTLLALILVGGLAFYAIARPMWQYVRQPWFFDAPDGKEEQIRQEQLSALESLRDLAMDYRLGQLSTTDYRALAAPLQQQARRTIQQQSKQNAVQEANDALDAALEVEILALRRIKPVTTGHIAASRDGARFCPRCGEAVEPIDRFCAACGAKLPERKPTGVSDAECNSTTEIATPTEAGDVSTDEIGAEPQGVAPEIRAELATENGSNDAIEMVATADEIDIVPTTATPKPTEKGTVEATAAPLHVAYRWWGIAALIVIVWVAAVIWLSMSSRAGQQAQSPVATLPVGQIQAIAVVNDVTVVGASDGIQRSTAGERWDALSMNEPIFALAVLDENSQLAAGEEGLWRSDDSGVQWQRVATDPADLRLVALSNVPGEAGLVWGADRTRLYLSHDGGITWGVASTSLPGQPRALAAGNGDLFIGTNRGVYLSQDRGESWIDYNGSVNGRIGTTDIQTVAYDPTGNIIFAGTSMGLFFMNLASPGGWGQRALSANVTALAVTGSADEELWVGTANGQLFRSTNRGVTWQ
jgi:rRNA maturation endonuclease Nob1